MKWPQSHSTSRPKGYAESQDYHDAQAEMMDDWHRTGSMQTSQLGHALFVGSANIPTEDA